MRIAVSPEAEAETEPLGQVTVTTSKRTREGRWSVAASQAVARATKASLLARGHGDGVARGLASYAVTVAQTPLRSSSTVIADGWNPS
jgi:hypothetical protein